MVVFLGTGINDVFSSGAGADRLEGGGGNDSLSAGAGADALFGDTGKDTLKGGNGTDTLFGGNGTDTLFGGGGADTLEGGGGLDLMYGGAGNDTLSVFDPGDIVAGEVYNGNGGFNILRLSTQAETDLALFDLRDVTLANLGALRAETNDDITVRLTSAQLDAGLFADEISIDSYDGDAMLEIHMSTSGTFDIDALNIDIDADDDETLSIIGTTGKDTIVGANGIDVNINAGRANDMISVSNFNHTVSGGRGNDTLTVLIDGEGGSNTLKGDKGNDTFLLDGEDNTIFGGDGADTFLVGSSGDSLYGGAGADVFDITGDLGALTDGGDGNNDIIRFDSFTTTGTLNSLNVSLQSGTMFYSVDDLFSVSRVVANVEHVIGSAVDDNIAGNDGNNSLAGGDGNDILSGEDGDDQLFGDKGSDSLLGGEGVDQLFGGNGEDTLSTGAPDDGFAGEVYHGGGGLDTLNVGASIGQYSVDLRAATLSKIETLAFADPGINGSATVIIGADQIGGGNLAADATIALSPFDDVTSTFEVRMDDATTVDLSQMTVANFSDASNDQIKIKGDGSDENITGTQQNDSITGGKGDDVLDGSGGDDSISGDKGADAITGGAGADQFWYEDISESGVGNGNRDVITDFFDGEDDQIGLIFDADSTTSGFQYFNFIGNTAFTDTAGELRTKVAGNGLDLRILLDSDGDGSADFEILLLNTPAVGFDSNDFFFLI